MDENERRIREDLKREMDIERGEEYNSLAWVLFVVGIFLGFQFTIIGIFVGSRANKLTGKKGAMIANIIGTVVLSILIFIWIVSLIGFIAVVGAETGYTFSSIASTLMLA